MFLLDVNALVALGLRTHKFHGRVALWIRDESKVSPIATTPISEIGFVRVLAHVSAYAMPVSDARALLRELKRAVPLAFVHDDVGAERLPTWVKKASQTTDGHLFELARSKGAKLATLDAKIPAAFLIP